MTTKAGRSSASRSQAVAEPGPQRRPAGLLRAGLDERDGRVVIDRLGVHRADDADVIDHAAGMRQQFARARRPTGLADESELRGDDRKAVLPGGHAGQPLPLRIESGSSLPCKARRARLVIEKLQMRRPAGLEEIDNAPGLGSEMRQASGRLRLRFAREQRRQGRAAESGSGAAEKMAAGHCAGIFKQRVHVGVPSLTLFGVLQGLRINFHHFPIPAFDSS